MRTTDLIFSAVMIILALAFGYGGYLFMSLLCGGIVVGILLFRFLMKMNTTDKIIQTNIENGNNNNIYIKKYDEANIDRFKFPISLGALALSMAFVFLAFNWAESSRETFNLGMEQLEEDLEIIPPQTFQKPPPPPPPPPPPKLEVVEDEEVLEEEPEIIDTEAEEETEIEIPDIIEEPEMEEIKEEIIEEADEDEIFVIVEQMPEFPGGQTAMLKFIYSNIKYPPIAKENGIEGTVYVAFVIDKTGQLVNPIVRRGIGGGCDQEVLRVLKKFPKWKPGKQRGKNVPVQFNIPVKFALE